MPWDFWLIIVVLAVVIPWRGRVRMRHLLAQPAVSSMERLALYTSTIAFQWLAVVIVGWRAWTRGLSAAALGLPIADSSRTVTTTVVLTAALLAVQLIGLRQSARLPADKRGFVQLVATKILPQTLVERLAFAAVVATVGVCEEFLYRGFLFGVFGGLSRYGVVLAVVGSSFLFSLAHLYQGRKGMATTFVAGLLFALTRVMTGNLAPGVVAHTAVDLTAGLLAPRLLGSGQDNSKGTIVTI